MAGWSARMCDEQAIFTLSVKMNSAIVEIFDLHDVPIDGKLNYASCGFFTLKNI
jgi:hypothetical protein